MSEKNEINISEIIRWIRLTYNVLKTKKLTILFTILVGSSVGMLYSILNKPKFKSTLTFVVEGESSNGLASLASSFLGKGGNNQGVFNTANVMDLLKSRTLVQTALLKPTPNDKKKSFADLYIESNHMNDDWEDDPEKKDLNFHPNINLKNLSLIQNEVLGIIWNTLILEEISVEIKNPENTIIYLTTETINDQFSRYFPEVLMKVVSEYYIKTKTRKSQLNYESLQLQTDSVRRELNNAIYGVASANDNTFLLNPAYNVKRVPSAHKEVDVKANEVILGELVKNLELARMNLLNETPIIEVIDTPVLPLKPTHFGKLKGIFVGGFLAGFLIILYLIFGDLWRKFITDVQLKENHQ